MEHRRNDDMNEAEPLNPVSLTLALWLGLIVSVTGMTRFVHHAAENAANARDAGVRNGLTQPIDPGGWAGALTVAAGG